MKYIYFDIETDRDPEAQPPEFVAKKNLKDPAKIKEDIASKMDDWVAEAALDPLYGQVVAIGLQFEDNHGTLDTKHIIGKPEKEMLEEFWAFHFDAAIHCPQWIGFCIHSFDLPFLVKRSWHHGVQPGLGLRNGRYWDRVFVDLRDEWTFGDRYAGGSLGAVAKFLGLGEKTAEGSGFALLLANDPKAAGAYLTNDLNLTRKVHERICLMK